MNLNFVLNEGVNIAFRIDLLAILAIKKQLAIAFGFGVVMMLVTYFYDKTVHSTFVVNSLHLPMSIARIHGKEEEVNTKRAEV